jgi:hypothetical protein
MPHLRDMTQTSTRVRLQAQARPLPLGCLFLSPTSKCSKTPPRPRLHLCPRRRPFPHLNQSHSTPSYTCHPHLLPPTCDASYLKAAIEAHAPEIHAFSPLLNVPISSFSAEVPRDWSVSDAGAFSEYDLFSLEGGANDPFREFDHVFHSCDRLPHASETPLFSQLPESGLVPSQVFIA